jgi:hypothetical protein
MACLFVLQCLFAAIKGDYFRDAPERMEVQGFSE